MISKRVATVLALISISALGVRGSGVEHRAHLSDDLVGHLARHTSARTRVIVHGDAAAIASLTIRHHVSIVRQLTSGSVIEANSAELEALARDGAIDHLSGDPVVRNSMSVSNQSMAADQVRAGTAGGLLGLGAVAGVTGQGVEIGRAHV